MGLGGVGLGGLLVGLGLKLVSATRLRSHGWVAGCWQPDYAVGCAWNFGWAELCLGGLLDGLRLGSKLLAGLGLRPVADT